MVFSSFVFLCFFLPTVLLLHTVIPNLKVKNALLCVASVLFYAYGEPTYVVLLLASVLLNYTFGRILDKHRDKVILAIAVIINIGMLIVFKYTGMLVGTINSFLPDIYKFRIPEIALPIGISFYTFQALSYVIDVYRKDVKAQKNFFSLLLYISFFPQLIAGPIVKYHDIDEQLVGRTITSDGIRDGIYRFCCGLFKKIIIANGMAQIADALFALNNSEFGFVSGWIAACSYFFQIYFDFSGYSDMAIGLGRMFGFHFHENFNHPYTATSVQDFWRKWHISLSTWFKEYLYIPLGGNRKGKARAMINRYIVFMATGIWHGANWTFLVWGLYHGTFLVFEQLGVIPIKKCKHKVINVIYTVLVALVGFVIFRADSITQAGAVLGSMIGLGAHGGIGLTTSLSYIRPYYILLFIMAIVGSTNLVKNCFSKVRTKLGEESYPFQIAMMVASLLVVLICFMQLASNSYNPFIYFRF